MMPKSRFSPIISRPRNPFYLSLLNPRSNPVARFLNSFRGGGIVWDAIRCNRRSLQTAISFRLETQVRDRRQEGAPIASNRVPHNPPRSEDHTSEIQSRPQIGFPLLL